MFMYSLYYLYVLYVHVCMLPARVYMCSVSINVIICVCIYFCVQYIIYILFHLQQQKVNNTVIKTLLFV